jgi:hypothetical protein
MITKEVAEQAGGLKRLVATGTSVLIQGDVSATPEGTKQVRAAPRRAALHRPAGGRWAALGAAL